MGTFNYRTFDYEFKMALALLNKYHLIAMSDDNFSELNKEANEMLSNNSDKVLPADRALSKYDRSTLNGKYITNIRVFPTGEVHISNGEETKTFYIESDDVEDRSADSIICDLQDRSEINVSKY